LQTLLSDKSWQVRVAAASAIAELNGPTGVTAAMIQMTSGRDEYLPGCSQETFDDGTGKVWVWRKSLSSSRRDAAALELRSPEARRKLSDALLNLLNMAPSQLDASAISQLGKLRDQRINDVLWKYATVEGSAKKAIKDAALKALMESRD